MKSKNSNNLGSVNEDLIEEECHHGFLQQKLKGT